MDRENANLIESPCIRECCLNEDDICFGCFRSLGEITCWGEFNNDTKRAILKRTKQRRREYSYKGTRE